MMHEYFEVGGSLMYAVLALGFVLLGVAALYALRGERRFGRVVAWLAVATFSAGLLATLAGISTTCRYAAKAEPAQKLGILMAGCEEALHSLVLAMIVLAVAGIVAAVGAFRSSPRAPEA